MILRGPGKISQVRIFDRKFIRAGQVLILFTQFRPDYFFLFSMKQRPEFFSNFGWQDYLFYLQKLPDRFRFVSFGFVSFRTLQVPSFDSGFSKNEILELIVFDLKVHPQYSILKTVCLGSSYHATFHIFSVFKLSQLLNQLSDHTEIRT